MPAGSGGRASLPRHLPGRQKTCMMNSARRFASLMLPWRRELFRPRCPWSWSMKARSRSSSTPTKRSKRGSAPQVQREQWSCARALRELRSLGEQRNIDGMARYGIRAKAVYGVSKPKMDELARTIGRDHELALELWGTGVHDARILA